MFLAVDIGNTQTTLGLISLAEADRGCLIHQWRMATDVTNTVDELHVRLHSYAKLLGCDLSSIDHMALASVVPLLSSQWEQVVARALHAKFMRIDPSEDCGITVALPDPTQAGADRIANAYAAKKLYGAPSIVVDFGTATNIDVINPKGEFVGGAIMPGLMVSAQSLFSRAARLSSISIECPKHALGTTTEHALQSGLVIGTASMIEGLIRRICKEIDAPDARVIATGGLAGTVAEATDIFDVIDPELTLRGIYEIWNWRTQQKA